MVFDKEKMDLKILTSFRTEDNYINLSNFYRKVFEAYLDDLVDLSNLDLWFKENVDNRVLISKEKADCYLRTSKYNFVYIRNNFFIERLNDYDLELLKKKRDSNVVDDEIINMVNRTFRDVIKYDSSYADNVVIHYDGTFNHQFVKANALVFVINYDIFELDDDSNFRNNYLSVLSKAHELKDKLIEKFKEKSDVLVDVLIVDCHEL